MTPSNYQSKATIVVPVFRPNFDFLRDQLLSIRDQEHVSFNCVVGFDGEVPPKDQVESLKRELDTRFSLLVFPTHLGLYRNVERLLNLVESDSDFVALADQDDVWHHNRLSQQIAKLVVSSRALVTSNGALSFQKDARSFFEVLRIDPQRFIWCLYVNQLVGASCVFKRQLLGTLLPFPSINGPLMHDHWLYLCALGNGGIQIDENISWIYRQHGNNLIGQPNSLYSIKAVRLLLTKLRTIVRGRGCEKSDLRLQVAHQVSEVLLRRKIHLPDTTICHWKSSSLRTLLTPRAIVKSDFESFRIFLSKLRVPKEHFTS